MVFLLVFGIMKPYDNRNWKDWRQVYEYTIEQALKMIRFVEHNDVDTEKWDRCIKRAINSTPYAFSWYLDIVVSVGML